jgi:hypothetical protein
MTRAQGVAWAAGFFDGEGYIAVSKSGRVRPVIEVSQINREPLDRLKHLFGGCVYAKSRPTTAGNTVYGWRITDNPALNALAEMFDFFTVKENAVCEVITYCQENISYSKPQLQAQQTRRANVTILDA